MSDKKLFYIEVKYLPQSWIAAICRDKGKTEHFFNHLPAKIKDSAQIKTLEAYQYPVYAVESYSTDKNSFRFVGHSELIDLIRDQNEDTVAHEDYVYFTFYTFEEDYFQKPTEKSLMGAMEHTHVNNAFLQDETLTKSEYRAEICSLVYNYDIDGLDQLYKLIITTNNDLAKYDLAHYGYLGTLWSLIHDYACNKLPVSGLDLMLDLIENAELLLEKKNWQARAEVQFVLLENACKKPGKKIITYLKKLNESLHYFLEDTPESADEIYQKQASAFAMVADALPAKHEIFWRKAISALQSAIEENPESIDWTLYAQLTFLPALEISIDQNSKDKHSNVLQKYQQLERNNFQTLLIKHSNYSEKMPYLYALNLLRLKEYIEWHKIDTIYFPQALYSYWLDKSVQTSFPPVNRIDLSEACHFFHTEGVRLSRIDLLEKVIKLYQRIIEKTEEYTLELYYMATALEDISRIFYQSEKNDEGNGYVNRAYGIYEQYLEKVKSNYSLHLHYAEFLERCYQSEQNILKPDLAKLREIAIAVEEQAKGFYSSPIFMRMRIALIENKEEEAIYHLTKSLILHELCIDNEVDQLIEEYKHSGYSIFYPFLLQTQEFMLSANKNYYYNPELRWETLKNMTCQETISYWEKRQNEIKIRPQS